MELAKKIDESGIGKELIRHLGPMAAGKTWALDRLEDWVEYYKKVQWELAQEGKISREDFIEYSAFDNTHVTDKLYPVHPWEADELKGQDHKRSE